MNTGMSRGRYMSVIFKTIIPLRLLRPLLIIFALIWAAGVILASFYHYEWAAGLTTLGAMISFMVVAVSLPPQVIALASCRSVNLLGNMRKTLLMIIIVTCVVLSAMVILTVNVDSLWKTTLNPLVALLMISFLITFSVWICSHWRGMHGFIFIPNAYFYYIFEFLNGFHAALLFAVLTVLWGVFVRWWFQWKPKKYHINFAALAPADSARYLETRQAKLLAGRGKSWIGSRLIGVPDGGVVLIKRYSLVLFLMGLLMAPGVYLFGRHAPLEYTANILVLLLLLFSFAVAQNIAKNIFKNLRYIWIYSEEKREKFFLLVLRRYCLELLPFIFLTFITVIAMESFVGAVHPVKSWAHFSVFVLLLFGLIFYFSWFAYQLGYSNLTRLVASAVVLSLWAGIACANGWIFLWTMQWKIISPGSMLLAGLLVLLLVHWKVRKGMRHVNFIRVV